MTFKTKEEQLDALRAPFDPSLILTREQGGTELSYYPAHTIQNRLLDVFGAGLSMTSHNVVATDDRVDLCVRLTLQWVDGTVSTIDGWGSADVLRSKSGTNKVINDPMKSAFTDGVKVAAAKAGVGLELYDKDYVRGLDSGKADAPPAPPKSSPVASRFKRG